MTEDETDGWHHRLNGHESEQTLGDGDGQGRLVCCGPWHHKELDTTQQLCNKENLALDFRLLKLTVGFATPLLWVLK